MRNVTVNLGGSVGLLGQHRLASNLQNRVNDIPTPSADRWGDHANQNKLLQTSPNTGLLGTTRLKSPQGQKAIQDIKTGDVLLDAMGRKVAVSHVLKTPETKTAIRIRAPYFGLDQDLIIGPEHHIAITSDIAEYLFGTETVLVPAWAIKDGKKARHWEMTPGAQLYQVQLTQAGALAVGNCAVESLPKKNQPIAKVLDAQEARCFAAEHKSGYQR